MAKRSTVKVPQKSFATREDLQDFIDREKEWMYTRIVDAIEAAYKAGQIEAHIFEAKIEESMSIISMNSEIQEWENSLTLAMKWFEENEHYEKCAKILKLIKNVRTAIL
jgi:hypothetical protein